MTAVLLPSPVPRHMSYSQLGSLSDCPLRYYLERVCRVPAAPNIAAIGGKATHFATELLDRHADAEKTLPQYLTRHYGAVLGSSQTKAPSAADPSTTEAEQGEGINFGALLRAENTKTAITLAYLDGVDTVESEVWATTETVPGSIRELWELCLSEEIASEVARAAEQYKDPSTWRAFGKATKAWPNKEDLAWWNHHGPIFIMRWLHWRATSGYRMVFLDGDPDMPAIEVDCSGHLGGVEIKGYIDRLLLDPWGQPTVCDIKTNSRIPTDAKQLGVYRSLLADMGFPRPAKGVYWWARSGEIGEVHDLTVYEDDYFGWEFRGLRAMRDSGFYPANTKSTTCSYCPVKSHCHAQGGDLAGDVPPPWQMPGGTFNEN